MLQAVGNILLQAAADDAVVIRYGGDEFVILLENATAERVQCINDGIQEALRVYNASGSAPLPVTLSAGTAEFDHTDIFSFFQEMDRRMYDEKRTFYIRNGINHL